MNEIILLLDQFLAQLLYINNYSKITISGIKYTVNTIIKDAGINKINEFTRDIVEEWLLRGRMNNNWKSATYISHHKHINAFLKWLVLKGKLSENFMRYIDKPKLENSLPRRLSKEEAENLLLATRRLKARYKFETSRNYSIIATLLFTGLRKSEILGLHFNDVDFDKMIITILQGKGKKDRIVPISTRLYAILKEYINERVRLNKQSEYFFVSSQKDNKLSIKTMDRLMQALKKKTGYDFSTHSLRHTFATLMIEGGSDIYTLSKIMGHSKITTTTIYLACSSNLMLKNIEKHPLN